MLRPDPTEFRLQRENEELPPAYGTRPLVPFRADLRPAELLALKLLRDQLDTGELRHLALPELACHHQPSGFREVLERGLAGAPARSFNMAVGLFQRPGKTCACYGGWMGNYLMPAAPDKYLENVAGENFSPLRRLLFPDVPRELWTSVTARQAVAAADNFLGGRDPLWREVLGLEA